MVDTETYELKESWKIDRKVKSFILIIFPFLISILIWGMWLNPETYWQKLISLLGGFITIITVFYIELELFN